MSPSKPARGLRPRRRAATPHVEGLEARSLLSTAQAPAPAVGPRYVPGEVLVQFKPGVGEAARAAARGQAEAALAESITTPAMRDAGAGVLERLALPAGRPADAAIRALRNNPNVAFAEPNWIYTTQATSDDPYYTNGSLWGMYGDDSTNPAGPANTTNRFGSQAEQAWAAGDTGLPNLSNDPASPDFAKRVYVGIIDEGVQFTHPDLAGNAWNNPFDPQDGIDNDHNGYVDDIHGWDFNGNNNTIYDGTQDDHGTHVAGTIAARGGNGQGVAGVNWDVTYIDAKFLGQFGGTTANAIKAVDYFTDLKVRDHLNVVALNNSWGGGGYSQGLHDAIIRAANANILFVAAAGNGGSDQVGDNNDTTASYPSNYDTTVGTSTQPAAGYDSVIAVAAIDQNGNLAGFSNYGARTVDLGAPGVAIYSTLPTNSYGSYSGTSMATPHVTGAAALYAATYLRDHGALPAADQIKQALLGSAIATDSLAGKTVTGGRLDVFGALTANTSPTAPPADPPIGMVPSGTVLSSSSILLSWTDWSNNEQGFEVQQEIAGAFQTIGTTGANATSFKVEGLQDSTSHPTPYKFRVVAFNTMGDSGPTGVLSVTTAASVQMPYTDHFDADPTTPGSAWTFSPPTSNPPQPQDDWVYDPTTDPTNPILRQQSAAPKDVEHRAMMVGVQGVPTEVRGRVRIDEWKPGEYARAGVALATDPRTTQGYSLVFTGRQAASNQLGLNDGSGTHIEFVNDYVAWSGWPSQGGVSVTFPIQVGGSNWYWFDMRLDSGKLYGKVWKDDGVTPEPAWPTKMDQARKISDTAATITFNAARHGWSRSGGVAALNGGYSGSFQGQDISYSKAAFDDVTAGQIGALPPISKASSLGLEVARVGAAAIAPPTVIVAGPPSGSGGEADPVGLVLARPRARRRWDGMRLS